MTFSIRAEGTRETIAGEIRSSIHRLGVTPATAGITDEEKDLLENKVVDITESIAQDYPSDSPVGVTASGTADNMHVNATISVNVHRLRPPSKE